MRDTSSAPLAGIRVLDLSRMFAAPWASQMLGDLGADVIKIERPGRGDEMRHYGPPFTTDAEGREQLESAYSLAANRNKRSITVDISKPEGQDLVRRLAKNSNVLLENFKVGNLARFGLDYESISAVSPDIIYCSVTGFGQNGPYAARPGVDTIFQAMSGMMSLVGEPDRPPQKVGIVIVDLITGLYATIGILAALRGKEQLRRPGQHVDLALLDSAIAAMSHRATEYLMSGVVPRRKGTASAGNVPARNFECADGTICVQAGGDEQFQKLARVIDRLELTSDPKFATRRARIANEGELIDILERIFRERSVSDWMALLVKAEVYSGPYYDVKQALEDPHVVDRGLVQEARRPDGETVPLLANPIRFSKTPVGEFKPPPLLGEHTDEVLAEVLGLDDSEIGRLRSDGVI